MFLQCNLNFFMKFKLYFDNGEEYFGKQFTRTL